MYNAKSPHWPNTDIYFSRTKDHKKIQSLENLIQKIYNMFYSQITVTVFEIILFTES